MGLFLHNEIIIAAVKNWSIGYDHKMGNRRNVVLREKKSKSEKNTYSLMPFL